jgi:hypothetical protein
MRRLALVLVIVALAGCVTVGNRRESWRDRSQEFLRPERPNGLLEGFAGWLDQVAARSS